MHPLPVSYTGWHTHAFETWLVWLLPMKIQTQKMTMLTPDVRWGRVFAHVVRWAVGAAARPWQWGPGCPNQHWSNACVRSEDFKKYIIPGELIVRISLATLAFHPHFAMVSRRSSQVRGPSVISSSWSPKPVVCLSLLGGEGGDRRRDRRGNSGVANGILSKEEALQPVKAVSTPSWVTISNVTSPHVYSRRSDIS